MHGFLIRIAESWVYSNFFEPSQSIEAFVNDRKADDRVDQHAFQNPE